MSLKDYLKEKRKTLSDSSLTTYSSLLKSLYKRIWDGEVEPKKFKETKKVLAALKDVPPNKRKTTLSALVIATGEDAYRDLMMNDIKEYNNTISRQEKSEAQERNWVTQEEVKEKYRELQKRADKLFKKGNLSSSEVQEIQNYIILALLSGVHIAVRRSKDFVDFKIRNVDEDRDNYVSKNGKELVFNSYKTAKHYGTQRIALPTKLRNVLKKWMTVNDSDYLLVDTKMNPLTGDAGNSTNGAVKLNQRLEKIFGKKVGVNGLRHSILTEKFGPQDEEMKKTMKEMGTSPDQLTTYVKKDD